MKVLITGASGQVGRELKHTAPASMDVICLARVAGEHGIGQLDITSPEDISSCLDQHQPDVVINAAAYTQVDRAEEDHSTAFAVNSGGAANLAELTSHRGIRLLHISTDFVFDGKKRNPYTPDDNTAPLGVYGASKCEGESRVLEITHGDALVVRSSWIYSKYGSNFVGTMLRLLRERDELRVVADQTGVPTWARSLANALWSAAVRPELSGYYHWVDEGVATWCDFATAIRDIALDLGMVSRSVPIVPITTSDYPTPAARPEYSVLDARVAYSDFGLVAQHWKSNLGEMLSDVEPVTAPRDEAAPCRAEK